MEHQIRFSSWNQKETEKARDTDGNNRLRESMTWKENDENKFWENMERLVC